MRQVDFEVTFKRDNNDRIQAFHSNLAGSGVVTICYERGSKWIICGKIDVNVAEELGMLITNDKATKEYKG